MWHTRLARLVVAGDPVKAQQHFVDATLADPSSLMPRLGLALLLERQGFARQLIR